MGKPEADGGPRRISVIIPAYNSSATIAECVESIMAAGNRPLEIIVVDDGSTDATPVIVEQLASRHPGMIQLVRLNPNGGPARARNRGAEKARGELLLFVDSDTRMLPDTITALLRRISEADAVSGIYDYHPINETASAWYQAIVKHYLFLRHGVKPYECFNGAIGSIQTRVFRELGGYNEALAWGMDYENEELGQRVIKAHTLLVDPGIRVQHVFPDMNRLIKLSFTRASLRIRLILQRSAKFESSGPVTMENGIATVAAIGVPVLLPLAWLAPFGWLPSLLSAALYLKGYGGMLCFVGQKRPGFLPQFLLMHLFLCSVLNLAAVHGLVRFLLRKPIGPSSA